jgi:FHS family L-fucose permease-like MFS transporter
VITYGLAFLETACNPYILAMGPVETANRRLNLAQAFNPIGSLFSMAVASLILAPNLEVPQLYSDIADKESAAIQYLITDENALSAGAELQLSGAAVQLADFS